MLQQHGFLLRYTQPLRRLRRLLRTHDQVPQQLPLNGVIRGQPQLREHELPLLGHVMQQRAAQQQAPVDGLRVHGRQKIGDLHHVGGVHQQPAQKGVVHALGRRDSRQRLAVSVQHLLRHRAVIAVLDGRRPAAQLVHGGGAVDGCGGHQRRHVHRIVLRRQTDTPRGELYGAPVFTCGAPHLNHLALVTGAQRPRIVPHLQLYGAGLVRQCAGQERLSVCRHLGIGRL